MAKKYVSCFLGVFVSIAVTLGSLQLLQAEAASAPAIYIFGDSTLDVGTNDFIPNCTARADFPFNGIDFPFSEPSGRFSNGLNTADEIAKLMGLKRSPPPFLYLVKDQSNFKKKVLVGVNFASGGSGILTNTGLQFNKVISLGEQIQQFSIVRSSITDLTQDETETDRIISEAFFLISTGSNDLIEFMEGKTTPRMSLPEFNATMLSAYENHLKNLYNLGARTFGILAVPPLGCIPFARALTYNQNCNQTAQEFAQVFNAEVAQLLEKFRLECPDIKFSLANTFDMTTILLDDMLAFGLKNVSGACCGNGGYPCNQTATLCSNRDEFLFWDRFHPTQKAAELAALTLFGASNSFVAPVNFGQLLGIKFN